MNFSDSVWDLFVDVWLSWAVVARDSPESQTNN